MAGAGSGNVVIYGIIATITDAREIGTITEACESTQTRPPTSDFDVAGTWSGVVGSRYTLVADYPDTAGATYLAVSLVFPSGYIVFGFTPFALPANAFAISVQVRYYDAEPSAGVNRIGGRLRVGGTYFIAPIAPMHDPAGTTYTARSDNWAVNPQTGIAWTAADINGTGANPLQHFGFWCTDATPAIWISCIEIQVMYSIARELGALTAATRELGAVL